MRDNVSDTNPIKTVYSIFSPGKQKLTSPGKLKQDLNDNPNPDIMAGRSNIVGFGKVIVPSIASLANGIVTSIAAIKNLFLCSITDTNELLAYQVKFDQINQEFTKAQLTIRREVTVAPLSGRTWEYIIDELITEEINIDFAHLAIFEIRGEAE